LRRRKGLRVEKQIQTRRVHALQELEETFGVLIQSPEQISHSVFAYPRVETLQRHFPDAGVENEPVWARSLPIWAICKVPSHVSFAGVPETSRAMENRDRFGNNQPAGQHPSGEAVVDRVGVLERIPIVGEYNTERFVLKAETVFAVEDVLVYLLGELE
jgi:hypothetical protein